MPRPVTQGDQYRERETRAPAGGPISTCAHASYSKPSNGRPLHRASADRRVAVASAVPAPTRADEALELGCVRIRSDERVAGISGHDGPGGEDARSLRHVALEGFLRARRRLAGP